MNKDFLYRLTKDQEYENILTEDTVMDTLCDECIKYYKLPIQSTNTYEIKPYMLLGEISLYILTSIDSKNYDEDTKRKLKHINNFLLKCLNDKNFCNTKIFLSYVRDVLKITDFPKAFIYTSNYYNDTIEISDLSFDEKLEIMKKNVNDIILYKDYLCKNIIDLLIVSLYEIFSKNYTISKCKNCDRFFISRNSTAFCNYASPQNEKRSCLQYSRNTSYVKKRKQDKVKNMYNKICNLLNKRYTDAKNRKLELYDKAEEDMHFKNYDDFKKLYTDSLLPQFSSGKITKAELYKKLEEKYNYYISLGGKRNGSSRTYKK